MKHPIYIFLIGFILFFSGKDDDRQNEFNPKLIEKDLAYIPSGTTIVGHWENHIKWFHDEEYGKPGQISLESFYMYNHEVSNKEYQLFINDLAKKDSSIYLRMLPDTMIWPKKYNNYYMQKYFRHPAYSQYPVVGISYEQAEYYCFWLTEKYMNEPKRKYKRVQFKLPTIWQWIYASKGGHFEFNFPWEGNSLQNKKGQWMANFRAIDQSAVNKETYTFNMNINKYNSDEISSILKVSRTFVTGGYEGPNSIYSYSPNGYGLYNMSGNVEEYVREKGYTNGGGWDDTGYYLQNCIEQKYDSTNVTSPDRGFRFVMEIVK